MVNIGRRNEVEAELWVVLHGLKMAWENGNRKVRLEFDSSQVIKWLQLPDVPNLICKNVLLEIKAWLTRQWEVQTIHVFREANRTANYLAIEAVKTDRDVHILNRPPGVASPNSLGRQY